MEDISDIVREAPFTLIASAIDKRRLKDQYDDPENPYHLALAFGLERIYYHTYSIEKDAKTEPSISCSRSEENEKMIISNWSFAECWTTTRPAIVSLRHRLLQQAEQRCRATGR